MGGHGVHPRLAPLWLLSDGPPPVLHRQLDPEDELHRFLLFSGRPSSLFHHQHDREDELHCF